MGISMKTETSMFYKLNVKGIVHPKKGKFSHHFTCSKPI